MSRNQRHTLAMPELTPPMPAAPATAPVDHLGPPPLLPPAIVDEEAFAIPPLAAVPPALPDDPLGHPPPPLTQLILGGFVLLPPLEMPAAIIPAIPPVPDLAVPPVPPAMPFAMPGGLGGLQPLPTAMISQRAGTPAPEFQPAILAPQRALAEPRDSNLAPTEDHEASASDLTGLGDDFFISYTGEKILRNSDDKDVKESKDQRDHKKVPGHNPHQLFEIPKKIDWKGLIAMYAEKGEKSLNMIAKKVIFTQAINEYQERCIHLAAANHSLKIFKDIYAVDPDFAIALSNQTDARTHNSLFKIFSGDKELIKYGELIQLIEFLIDKLKINVNHQSISGLTILHKIMEKHPKYKYSKNLITWLLKNAKVNPDVFDKCKRSPLHMAAECGQLEIVQLLVEEYHLDVNVADVLGNTTLHYAAKAGSEDVVRYLIQKAKANPGIMNNDGEVPLAAAAKANHQGVVKIIVEALYAPKTEAESSEKAKTKPDVKSVIAADEMKIDQKDAPTRNKERDLLLPQSNPDSFDCFEPFTTEQKSALSVVVSQGDTEAMCAVGQEIVYTTPLNEEKDLALHIAARSGTIETFTNLFDLEVKGATRLQLQQRAQSIANIKNKKGNTPLLLALKSGQSERRVAVVEYLVNTLKVNVNLGNDEKEFPIFEAVKCRDLKILKILIDAKVDINVQNNYGETAVHIAAKVGNIDAIRSLVGAGANLTARDQEGETPLHYAARENQLAMVQHLVRDLKVDPNIANSNGLTALHIAAMNNNAEVVKFLLQEAKASANAETIDQRTPLHLAVRYGHLKVIKTLVENGADIFSKNSEGYDAICVAAKSLVT